MQAIVTKYLGSTNHRGSRVKATAAAGSLTLPWEDRFNADANHAAAARALLVQLEWPGVYHRGGLPDGTQVWVCDTGDARDRVEVPHV